MAASDKMTPRKVYESSSFSRVPALLFYDVQGNKVLETDALVRHSRMMNSLNYVLEKAYEKDWTYQRFARTKGIEKSMKAPQTK